MKRFGHLRSFRNPDSVNQNKGNVVVLVVVVFAVVALLWSKYGNMSSCTYDLTKKSVIILMYLYFCIESIAWSNDLCTLYRFTTLTLSTKIRVMLLLLILLMFCYGQSMATCEAARMVLQKVLTVVLYACLDFGLPHMPLSWSQGSFVHRTNIYTTPRIYQTL